MTTPAERIDCTVTARGHGWLLRRFEVHRTTLLGARLRTGDWRHRHFVEAGGAVFGGSSVAVFGPGHRFEITAGADSLFVPLARRAPAVHWVLSTRADARDAPTVEHAPPRSEPIPLPMAPIEALPGLPRWTTRWLALPADVGAWAERLGVRDTSLAQRCTRLTGASPKRILSAIRATLAFELVEAFSGDLTRLALETGYSSHAHLTSDMVRRFGVPPSLLSGPEATARLHWMRLLRSALR